MPNPDGVPSIEVFNEHGKENFLHFTKQRLSRSPHPYHRNRESLDRSVQEDTLGIAETNLKPGGSIDDNRNLSIGINTLNGAWRANRSIDDSGTDADDESGPILQSLPAPPLKWRKGLRQQDGQVTPSPLLTPSCLDDDDRRLALERQILSLTGKQSPTSTDNETRKIREKFSKRRRAELLRRITECLLLSFVGYISIIRRIQSSSAIWQPEILTYILVLLGTYFLYPIRLFYRHRMIPRNERCSWKFIRIPAAFDPATLLYPVLIPIYSALSLTSQRHDILLPNLILSLSCIPRALLPVQDWLGYSSFHWTISTLPLLSTSALHRVIQRELVESTEPSHRLKVETLVLLYPLHQALMPILSYLTTTSLLAAELQLLSVSMINLLILSDSPQAVILKALLWIGGTSIFVLCGYVLHLGVELARIPSWRFRHPHLRSRGGHVLLSAIDDCFHRRFSKWLSTTAESEGLRIARGRHVNGTPTTTQDLVKQSPAAILPKAAHVEPSTQLKNSVTHHIVEPSGFWGLPRLFSPSQRRHTLPSELSNHASSATQLDLKHLSKHIPAKQKSHRLTALTYAQAHVVKWMFAVYVYSAVLVIVLFPVGGFISRHALRGREPIGWALGYLFGGISLFRQSTLGWSLEEWIELPEPYDKYNEQLWMTREKMLNQYIQGAANMRLLVCIHCISTIAIGLAILFRLRASVEVDTRRKVFHGMMVIMFLPSTYIDPPFIALAFVLILAVFLLLDLFRASQLPPLSIPLTHFLAPYVDGRDHRGPVIVSHIFLLIGCAIPLWLSLAGTKLMGEAPWEGWETASRDLGMVSGVICVGLGDAAASLIGRRYGRRRWCWSGGKSLEGSLAFALAVVLGLSLSRAWLLFGGWAGDSGDRWSLTIMKASVAAVGSSLTEAVLTGGNDNVIVPIVLWLLVRGLGI